MSPEKASFIGILIFLFWFCLRRWWAPDTIPITRRFPSNVAINCGSDVKTTALNGRQWVRESGTEFIPGKSSKTSVAAKTSLDGADPVPCKTARISDTEFQYSFQVNPGQKILRLHFCFASYRGFEESVAQFSVKAGPFTLLKDYSPSITANSLGIKYIVKEFFLNVEPNERLTITFSPSLSGESKNKVHVFVNGIEIISMPTGLYYTPENEIGARVIGSNRYYIVENSTALEVIQRFNVGGNSIPSAEDVSLFRQWNEDVKYLLEPKAHRVNHLALKIKLANVPALIAPPKIYQTCWKTDTSPVKKMYNFKWKIPIDLGFAYLVRLHFCEHNYGMAERESREFSILANNQIADAKVDVLTWSGDIGIPVYRDYIVIMEDNKEGSNSNLFIELQSRDALAFGLLNGLEIFKLSNLDNNLAAPKLDFSNRVHLATRLIDRIGKALRLPTILAGILIYYILVKLRKKNSHDKKSAESVSLEPSCRPFSLAQIKLATHNFSDALVIGKGGFAKVYKGCIKGMAETVAIKRLKSNSKQGAQEFWAEIETLSKLWHKHFVSLIGYCNESEEMILIYEYVSGGTLADNLYKISSKEILCEPLNWEQRLKICIGAARGLEYLHTGSQIGFIIHRDVNDTNILLDDDLQAKISDFGLSKLENITHSKSYISTKVAGTYGYLDPDYFETHRLTTKSDVYSFGVVMLVVLSGKPAVDCRIPGQPLSLVLRFQQCIAAGDIKSIVDPSIKEEISSTVLAKLAKDIESCLHPLPKKRPTMTQMAANLEQLLEHHLERITSSPPMRKIKAKPAQSPSSPSGRKDEQMTERGSKPVRKPFWNWFAKALWNTDNE